MTDVKKKKTTKKNHSFDGYLSDKQKESLHDALDPDMSFEQRIKMIQKIHRLVLRNHKDDEAFQSMYEAVITSANLFLESELYAPVLQITLPYWFSVAYFDYLYHVGVLTDTDLVLRTLQAQGSNSFDSSPHDA